MFSEWCFMSSSFHNADRRTYRKVMLVGLLFCAAFVVTPCRNGGAVAQSDTMRAPDSSGPIVTSVMIAAGVSQLSKQDWDLATAVETVRCIYREMWRVRGSGAP